MSFEALLTLAFVYFIFNVLGGASKRKPSARGRAGGTAGEAPRDVPPGAARSTTGTQAEGSMLEQMLEALEQAQRSRVPAPPRAPAPPVPEPPGSPRPKPMPKRPRPVVVTPAESEGRSLEESGFEADRRRRAAAEARLSGRSEGDHERFHRQVGLPSGQGRMAQAAATKAPRERPELSAPAVVTQGAPPSPFALRPQGDALRRAIVWSEVLGPPVALREREL